MVATMSPEDRLQIGANLQEVNIPPESVEDLLKGKVVMFYVTDSSGAKLTDSEVAKALAAKGFSQVDLISHENGGVVGVLRLLKAYQLAGLRFKPSAVPVSRILGGGG